MKKIQSRHGLSTLVTHTGEGDNPLHSHITPIFQTSTFSFPDVAAGAGAFKGTEDGYIYTRLRHPNLDQLALKIAALEGLDLIRKDPDRDPEDMVRGLIFSSGMSAITSAILARAKSGDTIIAQQALYGATYVFLQDIAPRYGIKTVFLKDASVQNWKDAFKAHPGAVIAYAESPANPTMALTDLRAVAEIAHDKGAWLMVDNTFASPYCQRPLTLGADVVIHSTTKYLCGHGLIVGGAVVSRHVGYIKTELNAILKNLGGNASPFDAWLPASVLRPLSCACSAIAPTPCRWRASSKRTPPWSASSTPGWKATPITSWQSAKCTISAA